MRQRAAEHGDQGGRDHADRGDKGDKVGELPPFDLHGVKDSLTRPACQGSLDTAEPTYPHIGIDVIRDASGTVWLTQDFSN
ncbi:hypothetical protein GCM10010170_065390 [Dactylosporangium salmoneum]|uniref:Uncharacterized protein n=1 Tax=Dactylosporangium salmoneum TaxID=53361 RepID=A0ABN3H160_9ACTN